MLGVLRDITAEVEAYQLLEQRVEERTREVSGHLTHSPQSRWVQRRRGSSLLHPSPR